MKRGTLNKTGSSLAVNMGEKNKTYISPDTQHQCCGSGSVCVSGLLDPDPLVPGTRYESGSFYHQAKIVMKTLIPTVLGLLYDLLSSKRKKQQH